MEVRRKGMSAFQIAEQNFLKEFGYRGGLTINEAISVATEDPEINFGPGFSVIEIVQKQLDLGFLEYEEKSGKFVRVPQQE